MSQLEHAPQIAEQEQATNCLIVAALLHDVGPPLGDVPEDIAERGINAKHEEIGHAWLKKRFGHTCQPAFTLPQNTICARLIQAISAD